MKKLFLFAAPFALLSAQEIVQDVVVQAVPATRIQSAPAMAHATMTRTLSDSVELVSMEMGSTSVVKNSPYSADAVTETIQTLADGNRIVRKNSVTQYRDGEGRTRREFEFQSFGPLGDAANGKAKSIMIDDPVSKTNYSLDTEHKMAIKMVRGVMMAPPPGMAMMGVASAAPTVAVSVSGANATFERHADAGGAHGFAMATTVPDGVMMHRTTVPSEQAKVEELGSRNIEGVEAKGTRNTMTIPAGEMGNERAIEVVSERWYSDQLKTFVLTKHSDPRFGETTLRLSNVRLGEPPATLFEVPADYTVQDASMKMQMMKKMMDEKERKRQE